MNSNLALLVPAPTNPIEIIALPDNSGSSSWESFNNKSITPILGFDIFNTAKANGIALLIEISENYSIWLKVRIAISLPISSLEAIKAIAKTATC